MNDKKIRTYDELKYEEKEVLDSFRKMKLMYDHARFKLHALQVENLIKDYEQLKKLREEIQVKYFSIYEELLTHTNKELKFGPVSLNVSDIVADTTYETYPYKLDILISKATSNHIPTIIFSLEDAISSNYAPLAEAYDGYVRIYMKKIPDTTSI